MSVYFCWQVRYIAAVIVLSCLSQPRERMEILCNLFCKVHVSFGLLYAVGNFPQVMFHQWECTVHNYAGTAALLPNTQCLVLHGAVGSAGWCSPITPSLFFFLVALPKFTTPKYIHTGNMFKIPSFL